QCDDDLRQCMLYATDDDCYPIFGPCRISCGTLNEYIDDWRPLTSTTSPSVTLDVLAQVFNGTLNEATNVHFRVTPRGVGIKGSMSNVSQFFHFAPPAPKSAGAFTFEPSCPDDVGTGVVHLDNITSQSYSYRYL